MKSWLLAVAAALLGLVAGCGVTWIEFRGVPEVFVVDSDRGPATEKAPVAKVKVIDGADYNFGVMEKGTKNSHEFVFKNEGHAPLKLAKEGKPTCKCTQFEV